MRFAYTWRIFFCPFANNDIVSVTVKKKSYALENKNEERWIGRRMEGKKKWTKGTKNNPKEILEKAMEEVKEGAVTLL